MTDIVYEFFLYTINGYATDFAPDLWKAGLIAVFDHADEVCRPGGHELGPERPHDGIQQQGTLERGEIRGRFYFQYSVIKSSTMLLAVYIAHVLDIYTPISNNHQSKSELKLKGKLHI